MVNLPYGKHDLRVFLWVNFYLILKIVTATIFATISLVATIFAVYNAGPVIETKYFPIIDDFNVESASRTGDRLKFKGIYHKVRECKAYRVTAYLTKPGDSDSFDKTDLTTQIDTGTARPLGWNNTTDWNLSVKDSGPGSEFFFTIDYNCHPGWDSKFTSRKFTVPINGEAVVRGDYHDEDKR